MIYSHLDSLFSHFDKYFSENTYKHKWMRNPFVDNAISLQGFKSLVAEQFIAFSSDLSLKNIDNSDSLTSF